MEQEFLPGSHVVGSKKQPFSEPVPPTRSSSLQCILDVCRLMLYTVSNRQRNAKVVCSHSSALLGKYNTNGIQQQHYEVKTQHKTSKSRVYNTVTITHSASKFAIVVRPKLQALFSVEKMKKKKKKKSITLNPLELTLVNSSSNLSKSKYSFNIFNWCAVYFYILLYI